MAGSPQKQSGQDSGSAAQAAAYPAATLAFYGPTDKVATKAVAAVVLAEGEQHPTAIKEWSSDTADVRSDPGIRQQILEFLQEEHVQRVVMADRIIGCPHVEGVDYPKGEACPYCPFWANRDRWTGQLLEER